MFRLSAMLGLQQASILSMRLDRASHNHIALFDLLQEAGEHWLFVEAPIVAKAVFVQIGLQVRLSNRMINTANPVLNEKPVEA